MGENWGCERKGDAAATCTVQRAHSFTAVPLAGCGTSFYMWFTTFARGSTGAVQRSCQSMQSTGGASAGDPRRSRPAQRAVRGGAAGLTIVKIMRITRRRSIRLPRASPRARARAGGPRSRYR